MKKLLLRLFAFFMDVLLVSFVVWGISSISFLNPNIDTLNHLYAEQSNSYKAYIAFLEEGPKIVEDSVITEEEYKTIEETYPEYKVLFKDVQVNEDLKNDFIKNLEDEINEQYQIILNEYSYKINQCNRLENAIAIVMYILYFGVFPYFTGGYTLFKKWMRLQTVSIEEHKKISLLTFILRAILINEIAFILMDIIGISFLKLDGYTTFNYWLNQIKYIYEMAFLVVLVMRDDGRSIHDLLLKTKVILLDKEGKEVESVLFKTTNGSETKKRKEEVKAIKVSDDE